MNHPINEHPQILNEHPTTHCAPNNQYTSKQLVENLVHLTVKKKYAESGQQNLACTHKAPTADTLLRRAKSLHCKDAYNRLIEANDHIIRKLKRKGNFKKPALAAADLSYERYYGKDNNQTRKGRCERRTKRFYMHASSHVVEASNA